jgi:tight adherence protein B
MTVGANRSWCGASVVLVTIALFVSPGASAAEVVPASLSDVRVTDDTVTATVVVRGSKALPVDPASIKATVGGIDASVSAQQATEQTRTTMLVIDTSGSMGATGMGTVRSAVREFLDTVPDEVKVGVVSFADTSGVDVEPTTDHAKVSRAVSALRSDGETALYSAIQDAVAALGTEGERSIVLLSDGGDTVAKKEGGTAAAASQRKAALQALTKGNVRAEVVAFKTAEANTAVVKAFAKAGGGSVASATDRAAVAESFAAAARALESQALVEIQRPAGLTGAQELEVSGTAGGQPFLARTIVNLGDTTPLASPSPSRTDLAAPSTTDDVSLTASAPGFLWPSVFIVTVGLFLLMVAFMGPVFRSRRKERLSAVEAYGFGQNAAAMSRPPTPAAVSGQLVDIGEKVMAGRESTPRTMQLMDRADLPWRAGEWFVLRVLAIVVGGIAGFLLFRSLPVFGMTVGLAIGLLLPPFVLRYRARRRARKFESSLPDVLMLVATSLSSGFSLLQSLDAVAKDAPEPAAKEFSRALAEARIGADVSDALEHVATRMDSENMRWATMSIRIQRDVGGNLAETLRTTAATLREREMLRRQVRTLSAEGRLSAYILIGLPIGMLFYTMLTNYDYVSLLWTTFLGILMSVVGIIAMIIGIFWMRNVVKIEV